MTLVPGRAPGLARRAAQVGPQGGRRKLGTVRDYKSHNASRSGCGEAGVPSGVCDLSASRPEASNAVRYGPGGTGRIAFALLRLGGGGKVGGVLERLGAGGRSPGFPGGFWGLPASCVRRGFPRRRGVELPLDGAEWAGRDRVGPRGGNRPKLQIA
ncbi:Embryonic Polyadenylate-Binding Protein 2 [Manis pentadactyla]|nr:Embryonic Polyadenylate-Binding Protein 2 [Manis pentadactyla]